MPRILCIHIPNWPIQRYRLVEPRDKRPILLHRTSRGARRVAAMSESVERAGVRRDMPWAEAVALVDTVVGEPDAPPAKTIPSVLMRAYDVADDRATLEDLAHWSRQFSPIVGLDDAAEPDSLFLDVTHLRWIRQAELQATGTGEAGSPRLRRELYIGKQVVRAFEKRGLRVVVTIADTLGAAWAVSHFPYASGTVPPRVRAGRTEHGSRLFRVPPGAGLPPLTALPIEALRFSQQLCTLLRGLGIESIRPLVGLPADEVVARLGMEPILRLRQLSGEVPEPITALAPRPSYRAERVLEYPVSQRDTIEQLVGDLTREIAAEVRNAGRRLLCLDWRLVCESRPAVGLAWDDPSARSASQEQATVSFSVGLYRPTASDERLLPLVLTRLERLRLPGPVWSLMAEAPLTVQATAVQKSLFSDRAVEEDFPAALVERLAGRLGGEAVLRVRLRRESLPEAAYRYEPLVGGKSRRRKARATQPLSPTELPPRPARLLDKPLPLPRLRLSRAGRPSEFVWSSTTHHVTKCWGPEQIETGWWRGVYVRRAYYRVETSAGQRFWIFRRLRDGQWFLHGFF